MKKSYPCERGHASRQTPWRCFALLLLWACAGQSAVAQPASCVVANLSPVTVRVEISGDSGASLEARTQERLNRDLALGDVLAFHASGPATLQFSPLERGSHRPSGGQIVQITPPALVLIVAEDGQSPTGVRTMVFSPNQSMTISDDQLRILEDTLRRGEGPRLRGYRSEGFAGRHSSLPEALLVPIKLLVDDDEAAAPPIWENRLRRRVAAANEVLERYFPLRLQVVAVETWHSDKSLATLEGGYQEFVRRVDPAPATIAIGFASQWASMKPPAPLAICAGPLSRHILLREHGPEITETERLEMLLHEIGHVFGAVHVRDSGSLMRIKMEERRARDRHFSLGFDPFNTLIVNLTIEEFLRGSRGPAEFSEMGRNSLAGYYRLLAESGLSDESAAQLAGLWAGLSVGAGMAADAETGASPRPTAPPQNSTESPAEEAVASAGQSAAAPTPEHAPRPTAPTVEKTERPGPSRTLADLSASNPLLPVKPSSGDSGPSSGAAPPIPELEPIAPATPVDGARWIIQAVVESWPGVVQVALSGQDSRGRLGGDQITELLVRQSAQAALKLKGPEAVQRSSFLLAIGVLVDDSNYLREQPGLGDIWRRLEGESERAKRLARIPPPTIQTRHDWAQHFGVSAALTELVGASAARSLGLAKEWRDAQGDSGFSFTDIAANYAGVAFAEAVRSGRVSLESLGETFTLGTYVPPLTIYEEGISFPRLMSEYGGYYGERTRTILRQIEEKIRSLY